MAEWLALAQALLEAGGWTVVVVLVTLFIVGLWRGWFVLRPWYREKVDELDRIKAAMDKMIAAELARERRRRRSDG